MSGEFRAFLRSAKEQGSLVREMTNTEGWQVLENWINTQVAAKMLQILDCPVAEVPEKRAEIRTLKSLLTRVKEFVQCGLAAEKEIESRG